MQKEKKNMEQIHFQPMHSLRSGYNAAAASYAGVLNQSKLPDWTWP